MKIIRIVFRGWSLRTFPQENHSIANKPTSNVVPYSMHKISFNNEQSKVVVKIFYCHL